MRKSSITEYRKTYTTEEEKTNLCKLACHTKAIQDKFYAYIDKTDMSLKSYNKLSNIQTSNKNENETDSEHEEESGNTSHHFSKTEINTIVKNQIKESIDNQTKCNWRKITKQINYQLDGKQLNNKAKYLRSKLNNQK